MMKLPYGYVLLGNKVAIHEENANVVHSIFEYYLAGASLGKIVDMLFAKGVPSPTGNPKWTRAAVDKLLNNKYDGHFKNKRFIIASYANAAKCAIIRVIQRLKYHSAR